MKENSWVSQLGVLQIAGIWVLLQGTKLEMLMAITMWGILSVLGFVWLKRCAEIQKAMFIVRLTGCIVGIYALVEVASWYSEAITQKWVVLILSLLAIKIGADGGNKQSARMAFLWEKIIFFGMVVILFFQIPNLEPSLGMDTGGVKVSRIVVMSVELFAVNLPYYMAAVKTVKEKGEEEHYAIMIWKNYGVVWALLFGIVFALTSLWEVELLRLAPFPYMLLGQCGSLFSHEAIHLEALNFMIVVVGLYLSIRSCMDGMREYYLQAESNYGKKVRSQCLFMLLAIAGVCMGCAPKLSDKQMVLIGGEELFLQKEQRQELSSMQVFVVRSLDVASLCEEVLDEPNLLYEIPVIYARKTFYQDLESEDSMEFIDELMKGGTLMPKGEYISIRQFLNSCYSDKTVEIPCVVYQRGRLFAGGVAVYKEGKRID